LKSDEEISYRTEYEKRYIMVDIDKLQLLMLSIMQSMRATAPGTGLTLKELTKEVNKSNDRKYSQITISRKIWAMRDIGYVATQMKTNKADMYYITANGKKILEVLLSDEE
jgi:hypothetical protein